MTGQIEVLPKALVAAAAAVRAYGREADVPLRHAELGSPELTAALADYMSRWSRADAALASRADDCSDTLVAAAEQYSAVESLLVPGALR